MMVVRIKSGQDRLCIAVVSALTLIDIKGAAAGKYYVIT